MLNFEERLTVATAGINLVYFQLPVFGQEDPNYRERTYCYELYHQLRKDWPASGYYLSAEIDKAGHPVIRGNGLDNTKPDFVVHVPEDMNNFAVIEVKPINGRERGILKDIKTMLAYLRYGNYARAYYLIYGDPSDGDAVRLAIGFLRATDHDRRISLWHHASAGEAAGVVKW